MYMELTLVHVCTPGRRPQFNQAQQADVGSLAMSTALVHDVAFPSNNKAL